MSEFESEEFKKVMILELTERIEELNSGLLVLEKDPTKKEAYEVILRVLHNLKGLFSLSGYPKISSLTHSMENLVTDAEETNISNVLKLLFTYVDELERFSKSLKGGKTPEALHFDELTQQMASIDEFMINLGSKLQIRVFYSPDCKVVSARSLVLVKKLQEKSSVNSTIPPLEEIEAGASFKELIIEITTQEDEEVINQIVEEAPDVVSVNVSRILESVTTTEKSGGIEESQEALTVRVNLEDLDHIIRLLGDLVVSGQFIREIGEQQAYSRSFKENLSNFERTIANIQDLVIRMRLVPLETILTRYPRMIRDLSQKEGKHVDFIVTGRNIGVDRSVIEKLVDPLNHLLRNALSHGIEIPEERVKKNKEPMGMIKLTVTHERSDIIIEVRDNGRGIDYEKIREKAEKKGLVIPGAILTKNDLHSLLFDSSFTTAEETTEISGRGVGLSVVKSTMESVGGNIEVDSEPGKFTSFRLVIPLSVAITKVLMLSVKKYQFAIPMANIEQILSVPVRKILIDPETTSKSIIVDNTSVPIIDLRERLKFHSLQIESEIETGHKDVQKEIVVLWRKGNRSLGFLVNELLGEREVVMKPIQNFLSQIGAFSSATVLEGGKVVLIIDPMNFLEAKVHA
ncbi:MAG: chemotaxis protein CheA [Candidatus Heimdallarchaeota archaeon]|nr:MAG: chemotaxis protein CheA [Candidatus Heimdallarchaeota archaeon]